MCESEALLGTKPTVSCETLSAIWLVWCRKRTVETSPSAAKHLKKKNSRAVEVKPKKKKENQLESEKAANRSLFRLGKKNPPER